MSNAVEYTPDGNPDDIVYYYLAEGINLSEPEVPLYILSLDDLFRAVSRELEEIVFEGLEKEFDGAEGKLFRHEIVVRRLEMTRREMSQLIEDSNNVS